MKGWNDGKIRAIGPESGRMLFTINDAHKGGVTALAVTNKSGNDTYRIISGGMDGQVRVWRISSNVQVLEHALKEHKGISFHFHQIHCDRNGDLHQG